MSNVGDHESSSKGAPSTGYKPIELDDLFAKGDLATYMQTFWVTDANPKTNEPEDVITYHADTSKGRSSTSSTVGQTITISQRFTKSGLQSIELPISQGDRPAKIFLLLKGHPGFDDISQAFETFRASKPGTEAAQQTQQQLVRGLDAALNQRWKMRFMAAPSATDDGSG